VVTAFHGGPVSPTKHHFSLANAVLLADGGVRFHIYLDAGTPEAPAHVMKAELVGSDGKALAGWSTEDLTRLKATDIHNDFAYNKFKAGPYGLVAPMGAMATITLPPPAHAGVVAGPVTLKLTDVNGGTFTAVAAGTP